jgi:hypothetical protein
MFETWAVLAVMVIVGSFEGCVAGRISRSTSAVHRLTSTDRADAQGEAAVFRWCF